MSRKMDFNLRPEIPSWTLDLLGCDLQHVVLGAAAARRKHEDTFSVQQKNNKTDTFSVLTFLMQHNRASAHNSKKELRDDVTACRKYANKRLHNWQYGNLINTHIRSGTIWT